jgi:hypothetical protein
VLDFVFDISSLILFFARFESLAPTGRLLACYLQPLIFDYNRENVVCVCI